MPNSFKDFLTALSISNDKVLASVTFPPPFKTTGIIFFSFLKAFNFSLISTFVILSST